MQKLNLPELPYKYDALKPYISEEQLKIHHQKHHKAYVDNANGIIDKIKASRKDGTDIDMKSTLKSLTFNVGGHALHSLFWRNLSPKGGKPSGDILDAINKEFGSFDRFKKEFNDAAISTEGSGWAVLSYCKKADALGIMQIEKHNVNLFPSSSMLLVLDVWEHAYYLDYKNLRAKFVDAFWNIVDWDEVNKRFKEANR